MSALMTHASTENPMARRMGEPFGSARRAAIQRPPRRRPSNPEVTRCVNSMRVLTFDVSGRMAPPQFGQETPHPSPESEARTHAPKRMTSAAYTRLSLIRAAYTRLSLIHGRKSARVTGGKSVSKPKDERVDPLLSMLKRGPRGLLPAFCESGKTTQNYPILNLRGPACCI